MLFFLNNGIQDLQNLIVVWPGISNKFGKDQDIIDINFKGSYSREDDLLVAYFIEVNIFLKLLVRRFSQFVRNGVFNNDGIGDVLLNFFFYFNMKI